jgi:creatine kinase
MVEVLRENPGIYLRLKNKTTEKGVNLGNCIKTGMDNKGDPLLKTVGIVAGDEESYELFGELFD